jgi:photosystem II PsbU protein
VGHIVFIDLDIGQAIILITNSSPHSTMSVASSLVFLRAVAAFAPSNSAQRSATELAAERRDFLSQAAIVAGLAAFTPAANAIRDYDNVGLLGGSSVVDINNANVRVYLKMPGLYPTVAGKIASNGPYKSVGEVYSIPGLTGAEKDLIKKYESRFTTTPPAADYVIDRINNGLYR